MKVLVLGAEGMIGSELMRVLSGACGTTIRSTVASSNLLTNIDVANRYALVRAFKWAAPQVVINCVGIVKSECYSCSPFRVEAVNGLAPHEIASLGVSMDFRVIHLSTDCVFSGGSGNRTEADKPDASDVYGASKKLGELHFLPNCVTLRTSFIGRDRKRGRGLLEWLLARPDDAPVPGRENEMWSGLSTIELARVIRKVIEEPSLNGLYHVAGPRISKADLLTTLSTAYGRKAPVKRDIDPRSDRTLDGSKFNRSMKYSPPSWEHMAKELASS